MISTIASGVFGVTYGIALFFHALTGVAQMVPIPQQNLRYAQELGHVEVVWTPNGIIVAVDGEKQLVNPVFVDKEIRHLDSRQMMYWLGLAKDISLHGETVTMVKRTHEEFQEEVAAFMENEQCQQLDEETSSDIKRQLTDQGGYLEIVQLVDGSFAIHAKHRLPGGGIFGGKAGAWIGYVGTHLIAQTVIHAATGVVAIVCPPAAPVAYATMQSAAAAPVQALAVTAAVAGGITGAVVTGPV